MQLLWKGRYGSFSFGSRGWCFINGVIKRLYTTSLCNEIIVYMDYWTAPGCWVKSWSQKCIWSNYNMKECGGKARSWCHQSSPWEMHSHHTCQWRSLIFVSPKSFRTKRAGITRSYDDGVWMCFWDIWWSEQIGSNFQETAWCATGRRLCNVIDANFASWGEIRITAWHNGEWTSCSGGFKMPSHAQQQIDIICTLEDVIYGRWLPDAIASQHILPAYLSHCIQ